MKKCVLLVFGLFFLLVMASCDKDTPQPAPEVSEEPRPNPVIEEEPEVFTSTLGTATFFDSKLPVEDNYILVNDAAANRVYLMDKEANLLYDLPLNGKLLGNDVQLESDGSLLAMLEANDPKIEIGGFGGVLQQLDKDGNVLWNFEYASDDYILHHDAEYLPNGNIITMIWEKKSTEEAIAAGSSATTDLFPDGIIEIDPATKEIVWEWHVWDHLVQNHDDTKANFGIVGDNPQLIDLNYVQNEEGDITHANGISYDPTKDVIFLSVNFFSEVWVIDHSTTTQEAASHTGGNFNKGGDLVYRFGNPRAYDNPNGTRLFHNNHYPNLLKGAGLGNILIFSNGAELNQSTVYELKLPSEFNLSANLNNEPEIVWSFSDPELYSPKVSGAVRLPNGNTLITEGIVGFWEVTPDGEVAWKFEGQGFFWRGYHFDKNSPSILALDLQ